jgi:hypothetical protein
VYADYEEFFSRMNEMASDSSVQKQAAAIAELLGDQAHKNAMTEEYITDSVLFFLVAADMMNRHSCNVFSIECFELTISISSKEYLRQ